MVGTWRAEHLFALKQALNTFDFIGTQLVECDVEIERQMQKMAAHDGKPQKGTSRHTRNAPKFDLHALLFKMCGVDLTRAQFRRQRQLFLRNAQTWHPS